MSAIIDERQQTLKAVLHYFYKDNAHSGPHSRYNLKYHIVWIPKYRRKFMVGAFAERLKEVLHEISGKYGFTIIAQEVMPDHIHLLLEAPPKYAPAKIVGILKGVSSKLMRQEFHEEIKKHIWKENTLWATGYYMATLSDGATTGMVQEYIENQKKDKNEESGDQLKLF
ncbi:MAG: IS200/IS605 family transposase [Calditrichaeota bacterium]|mgnify:CR=1 FL=1|jgi:putative transposase|nr:IS200/IS605 family transposase [Calditrichota bacterium]